MNQQFLLNAVWIFAGAAFMLAIFCLWLWWRSPKRRARKRGREGERRVAKELSRLRSKDFITLNDLLISTRGGNTVQIDHVVVSTRGIFVIETKAYAGIVKGKENEKYWEQRMWLKSRWFYNPLWQNDSHVRALRAHLRGVDPSLFTSIALFVGTRNVNVEADDLVIARSFPLPDKHIRRTLDPAKRRRRHWWCRGGEVVLDEHKIAIRFPYLLDELKRRPRVITTEEMRMLVERIASFNITDSDARRRHRAYAASKASH